MDLATKTLIVLLLIVIVLGLSGDISLRIFFTNIVLLIAPIGLYFWKVITEQNNTITEIQRLRVISERLVNNVISNTITDDQILVGTRQLQTAIYSHRKTARPTPDWLHKSTRFEKESESSARIDSYINQP